MSSAARSGAGAPVAVTGAGVVSPIGNDLDGFDEALFAGRSAVRAHRSTCPASTSAGAGRRRRFRRRGRDRAVARAARPRHGDGAGRRRRRRAATPASSPAASIRERLGIFWGSGMAGAATFEPTCRTVYAERRRMRPTSVVTTMPNAPVAELALRFGARGAALAYACACASSAVAIGEAMRAIRAGWIDVAIAGGSESLLTPGVLASWQAMRVLTPLAAGADREASAQRACRPFAADRAGFALGEAAAAFILESTDACARRAARRLASTSPAMRPTATASTSPSPTPPGRRGRCAPRSTTPAWPPTRSATSTPTARRRPPATPPRPNRSRACSAPHGVPVSSTKAIHGHLLGAGGAVELLAAARALVARTPAADRERRARRSGVRARSRHGQRARQRAASTRRCRTRSRSAERTRC